MWVGDVGDADSVWFVGASGMDTSFNWKTFTGLAN